MAHRRASIGIFHIPWEPTSCCHLWAVECWECSCSCLLFKVSLLYAPLPSLLNTFSNELFTSSLSVHTLSVSLLVSTKTGLWECATSCYSPRVFTYPLSFYSPRVFTRPLCPRSPQVFTYPLRPHSPQVNTRILWGRCTLPTRHLIPLCAGGCGALWRMLGFTVSFAICMWGSSLLTSNYLASLWFWLSLDLGIQILL